MLMTNRDVGRVFANIAVMLEMEGANPFRVRAYREAARVIESQAEPVATLALEEGRLESLGGIGKDLAAKIRDVVTTGTTEVYEELKARIPVEVVALTELQGLGPKRVGTLFEVLGVRNRDDLEKAAKAGKLRDLPGFGEKLEQNVLRALSTVNQWSGRVLLAAVWPVAHAIADHVRAVRGVTQVDLAGSFRRRKETVGDLDILCCGGDPDQVMAKFATHPAVAQVLGHGETKSSVKLASGLQVDLRLVPEESYGAALLYFTGSKEHNIELRKIAIEQGMSLNEYGLTRGDRIVAGRTEEEVYQALGASWIPPELREARGEIGLSRFAKLPPLLEIEDLRADLHMHTDRTDGRDTLEAMVRAAKERGHEYVAITDHSKSLAMTFGFDGARVRQSAEEIAEVRRQVPGIEVLHGLEVDILADGALDLDDESLALLDWVIIAIHSRLDQDAETATRRVLRALENPLVHAMAHPTGRLIGGRDAMPLDLDRVFARAAERAVAMEISAQPERSDLSDAHARLAREKGVKLVVNTDAHSAVQLDYLRFGVFAARRAGLGRDDVLNALPYLLFRQATSPGRKRPGRAAGAPAAAPEPAEVGVAPAAGPASAAASGAPKRAGSGRKSGGQQEPPAAGPQPRPSARGKVARRPK